MTLLEQLKANLIISHNEDDELLETILSAAVSYAESYQHLGEGTYAVPSLTIPTDLTEGSHYFYCELTAGATTQKTTVATVTVAAE